MTFPAELQTTFFNILNQNNIKHKIGWSNFLHNVNNPAAVVVNIRNVDELSLVLQQVQKFNSDRTPLNKVTLRAAAGWASSSWQSYCCLFPWSIAQETEYAAGFSFSEVVGGRASVDSAGTDIIIRFAKSFHRARVIGEAPPLQTNDHSEINKLPGFFVEVSAGLQLSKLSSFLRNNNLSLPTVSVISGVSAVGLAGTAGYGTGKDQPAFSGLIEAMTIYGLDGIAREIDRSHPDFEQLAAGHSGLLGVITKIKLRVVQAFNLRETIAVFNNSEQMTGKLNAMLQENEYVTFLGMPSSDDTQIGKSISKWQIRKWNYTKEQPRFNFLASYEASPTSLVQELEVRIGASIMEYLMRPHLKHLLPAFLAIGAAQTIGTRGTHAKVDFENKITHPQVAFPKTLHEVSYLIPVDEACAGQHLETLLHYIEGSIKEAGTRGEYPISYAVYVRYIKGTNGGLSTSSTSNSQERILAIDLVSHPKAPGLALFEYNFVSFLKSQGFKVRYHLGKNFPYGVTRYDQFLEPAAIQNFTKALERWCASPNGNDGAERLAMSPFLTPYLKKMLDLSPAPELNLEKPPEEVNEIGVPNNHDEIEFLNDLINTLTHLSMHSSTRNVTDYFLEQCKLEVSSRKNVIPLGSVDNSFSEIL